MARKVKVPNKTKLLDKREAFLRQSEKAVKISLLDGLTRYKQRLSLDKLGKMYEDRDYKALDKHISWDDIEVHLGSAKDAIGRAIDKTTAHAVDTVSADEINPKHIANVSSRITQMKLKARQRDFLKDIGDNRKSVHALIADGHKLGRTPKSVAQAIKGQIGLNDIQRGAIDNLQRTLEKKGLSPSVIKRRIDAKERKSLNYRAETIAITETRVAAAAAEDTVWKQQVKDGLLPKEAQKVWLCEPDACEKICRPLDNVAVPLNDPWILPNGDECQYAGAAHPRCRCVSTLSDDT